jgi:DNA-binding transcriptional MerR regulator
MQAAKAIPDKLFFKIGEVCDITGIQAHVLRYWETEFPQLAPQKNRAGQRVYRRRDVEVVLRIKELLYDEGYTIAGAKKRLAADMRTGAKLKVVTNESPMESMEYPSDEPLVVSPDVRQALARIRQELEQLLTMLKENDIKAPPKKL